MARLSSGDADYARRRAAHEEERRQEFRRSTGRSTSSFFQISQRDANAFNRAFERGMQQQIRVAGMIGIIGTVSVGGYYAPGAYQLTAPHLARGYAWARSPQTRALFYGYGARGVELSGKSGIAGLPLSFLNGISREALGRGIPTDNIEWSVLGPVGLSFGTADAAGALTGAVGESALRNVWENPSHTLRSVIFTTFP